MKITKTIGFIGALLTATLYPTEGSTRWGGPRFGGPDDLLVRVWDLEATQKIILKEIQKNTCPDYKINTCSDDKIKEKKQSNSICTTADTVSYQWSGNPTDDFTVNEMQQLKHFIQDHQGYRFNSTSARYAPLELQLYTEEIEGERKVVVSYETSNGRIIRKATVFSELLEDLSDSLHGTLPHESAVGLLGKLIPPRCTSLKDIVVDLGKLGYLKGNE